jgi:hypothetical protein
MLGIRDALEWCLSRGGFAAMVCAPLWLPLVGWWWPARFARRLRSACGYLAVVAAAFMLLNCGDRSPLQWPSAMLLVGSLLLYFAAVLTSCLARDFHAYRARRRGDSAR